MAVRWPPRVRGGTHPVTVGYVLLVVLILVLIVFLVRRL
jgi:hypothetical protein